MLVPAVLAAFLRTMTGAMAAGLTVVTGVSVSGETCALIEPRLLEWICRFIISHCVLKINTPQEAGQ